jgi:flagellar biosynthesis/type III secretory pathway protein FliH
LEFLFIELPKFKPQNRAERKLHELWLRFLTEINENTEEIPEELLKNEHIREAVGYMERSAYSKEQLQAYDKWKINILTERGMIDDAREEGLEQGREQGREEGREEGLEQGRKEGRKEGREEGREEGETIVFEKVVVNSHRSGYSIEAISTTTGLTSGQIIEILKRHGLI